MESQGKTILFVVKGSALNRNMNTGLENLAWGLAAHGCRVHILSGGSQPVSHAYSVPNDVTYHFTGRSGNPIGFLSSFRVLSRSILFDAIVGWVSILTVLALAVDERHVQGRPTLLANHGKLERQISRRTRFTRFARRQSIILASFLRGFTGLRQALSALKNVELESSRIQQVVSISQAADFNVRQVHGFAAEKCSVIARGVDTTLFSPRLVGPRDAFPSVRLLYTGNVLPSKGVGEIVDAIGELMTPINLVLCGNGSREYVNQLRKRLASFPDGGLHKIEWGGAVVGQALIRAYQAADLFVFPSSSEGLGKSLLEAMACQLPVIASRIPPFTEFIQDRVNGLLVELGSSKSVAMAIQEFLDNPALRDRCARSARKTVVRHFSRDTEINSWLRVLYENSFSDK